MNAASKRLSGLPRHEELLSRRPERALWQAGIYGQTHRTPIMSASVELEDERLIEQNREQNTLLN
jgi:hypothetical protein